MNFLTAGIYNLRIYGLRSQLFPSITQKQNTKNNGNNRLMYGLTPAVYLFPQWATMAKVVLIKFFQSENFGNF
jgi:hypothetical protein